MRRRLTNRGEALAELAAAKAVAGRKPSLKSAPASPSGKRTTAEVWRPQAPALDRPSKATEKKGPRQVPRHGLSQPTL